MAQMTSGKVLRETRERKGYDLTTVARRLRIRPDILRAIEAGDFSAMPPRGYTRNMVNAYARLLGLNPTEIVNMYLDEAYANQVEKARDTAPSSGFHMERETRRSRSRIGVGSGAVEDSVDDTGVTQYTRRLYDDSTQYSRDDYGITRQGTNKAGRSERDFSSHHSGYGSTSFNIMDSNSGIKRGGKNIYAGQTGMQYTPSRVPGFLQSRGAIIAIAAIVLVVIIAIVVVATGNRESAQNEVNTNINGVPNTGTIEGGADTEASEPAPTSVRVVYTVAQGSSCMIVTDNDGTHNEEELAAQSERTVDVTGTFKIATFTPEALTVTVDGEKVQLKQGDDFNGMYGYEVKFSDYLDKWRATHSGRDAQRQAAIAEAGDTTPSSSSASASSTDVEDTTQTADDSQYYTEDYTGYDYTDDYGYYTDTTYGTDYTGYDYTGYDYTDYEDYGYTDYTG